MLRITLPVFAGAQILWWVAVGSWLRPIYRAIRYKRRGKRLDTDLAASAYAMSIRLPIYTLVLRTVLWAGSAATIGFFLTRLSDWEARNVLVLTAASALLSFSVNTVRSFWYQLILARLRAGLFSRVPPLRRFADSYKSELLFASMVTSGATAAAVVAFVYFSLPIAREQFVNILTTLPLGAAAALVAIVVNIRMSTKKLDAFLNDHLSETTEPLEEARSTRSERDAPKSGAAPGPTTIYRLSQVLPYRQAALNLAAWCLIGLAIAGAAPHRVSPRVRRQHLALWDHRGDRDWLVALSSNLAPRAHAIAPRPSHGAPPDPGARHSARPLFARQAARFVWRHGLVCLRSRAPLGLYSVQEAGHQLHQSAGRARHGLVAGGG